MPARKREEASAEVKKSALDQALANIEKKFGAGVIRRGNEIAPISRIPCGIFALDCALGTFEGTPGFPRGRASMLVGEESSCKTFVATLLIAEFQRRGEQAVLIDVEGDWDPVWGAVLGVRPSELLVQPSESAEQALDIIAELVRALPSGLIVVDSWAMMAPAVEIEESFDDQQRGTSAKLNNKAWRNFQSGMNLASRDGSEGPTMVNIQQWRTGFSPSGGYRTISGGAGQKYASSVTVSLKEVGEIYHLPGVGRVDVPPKEREKRDKLVVVGSTFAFHIDKNKTAPPNRSGEFEVYTAQFDDPVTGDSYRPGTTNVTEQIVQAAVFYGIVQRSGAWYAWGERKLGQGILKAVQSLQGDRKAMEQLKAEVLEHEARRMGSAPPDTD